MARQSPTVLRCSGCQFHVTEMNFNVRILTKRRRNYLVIRAKAIRLSRIPISGPGRDGQLALNPLHLIANPAVFENP